MPERLLDQTAAPTDNQVWTAINKLNNSNSEQSKQLAVLTSEVEGVTRAVAALATNVDRMVNRIEMVERPDVNLWLKVSVLVISLGAGLWAMAIRPIENDIQQSKEERNQMRATMVGLSDNVQDGFRSIAETRWTEADARAQQEYLEDTMNRELGHLKEQIEMHTEAANHPYDVLNAIERLRTEMYLRLSERANGQ